MNKLDFAIVPKAALGDIQLGSTLNTVFKQVQATPHRFVYSAQSILDTPYILQLKRYHIQFIFNQSTQRLVLIEILQPSALGLSYRGKQIREWDIKTVYNDVFGPTYQGIVVGNDYILSYPGLSFKLQLQGHEKAFAAGDILSRLLERNAKVAAIAVHPYKQYSDMDPTLSYSLLTNSIEVEKLVIESKKPNSIQVKFLKHPQNLKSYPLVLNKSKQQDVLCTLGPPDDVFRKIDNRTQIHSSSIPVISKGSSTITPADFDNDEFVFHNYYHFGFDLLYSNMLLTKIIIHNNSPLNKLLFGKYEKCSFEYIDNRQTYDEDGDEDDSEEKLVITGDIPFKKIKSQLNLGNIKPIIINRSNRSVGHDIELIDSFEFDDDGDNDRTTGNGTSNGRNNGNLEVKSLCFVDDLHGFNWDVFGEDDSYGVVESLTIY